MGNIAFNKTAAAGSYVMPYTPSRAVDGKLVPSGRWLCSDIPNWLSVDLGAAYLVNRWVVKHMPVVGWATNYANSDFKLQGSNNNVNWTDLDTLVNNTSSITDRLLQVLVGYRYFRVYITKGLQVNNQTASIVEFEVYQAYSNILNSLTISAGTLSPVFNPNTLAYTATVNSDVANFNVTPTALDPQAVIKLKNPPS
jgi:hypothetical protein